MLKTRFTPGSSYYNSRILQNGVVWSPATTYVAGGSREELITFSNPYDRKKGIYTSGQGFFQRRVSQSHNPGHFVVHQPWKEADVYIFTEYPSSLSPSTLPAWASAATMNAYGSTGIRRASPNEPHGGLSQFIGELHQVPSIPRLNDLRNRSNALRNAGSQYLNIQFGWLPFLSDLIQFVDNVNKSDRFIKQLDRDSGRSVRRGSTVLSTSSTSTTSGISYGSPGIPGAWLGSPHTFEKVTSVEEKVWFSGKFHYFIPVRHANFTFGESVQRFFALSRILYGLEVTPRLVWELTPWSWLLDWCSNAGDLVANATNFGSDGLTMDYGFVMRSSRSVVHHTVRVGTISGILQPTSVTISETKQRAMATPYGFGLNPNTFTSRQAAILGAIAASRS